MEDKKGILGYRDFNPPKKITGKEGTEWTDLIEKLSEEETVQDICYYGTAEWEDPDRGYLFAHQKVYPLWIAIMYEAFDIAEKLYHLGYRADHNVDFIIHITNMLGKESAAYNQEFVIWLLRRLCSIEYTKNQSDWLMELMTTQLHMGPEDYKDYNYPKPVSGKSEGYSPMRRDGIDISEKLPGEAKIRERIQEKIEELLQSRDPVKQLQGEKLWQYEAGWGIRLTYGWLVERLGESDTGDKKSLAFKLVQEALQGAEKEDVFGKLKEITLSCLDKHGYYAIKPWIDLKRWEEFSTYGMEFLTEIAYKESLPASFKISWLEENISDPAKKDKITQLFNDFWKLPENLEEQCAERLFQLVKKHREWAGEFIAMVYFEAFHKKEYGVPFQKILQYTEELMPEGIDGALVEKCTENCYHILPVPFKMLLQKLGVIFYEETTYEWQKELLRRSCEEEMREYYKKGFFLKGNLKELIWEARRAGKPELIPQLLLWQYE